MEGLQGHRNASALAQCSELIVVCCHATYIGNGTQQSEADWILQAFQRSDAATHKPSEHETFLQHVQCGALLAQQRSPKALLIFSGGQTTASNRSEAAGYALVLDHLLSSNSSGLPTAFSYGVEENATDSYQNLLFSILRFRHLTGSYPESITVITHAFKERRFLDLHAAAIKWPSSKIRVQGINPPFTARELKETQDGEMQRAYALFETDPYGVRPPLSQKRIARNWNPEGALDTLGDNLESAVAELLTWTGGLSGREVYPKTLPWEAVE